MTDFFDLGAEWLAEQGKALAGRALTIQQGRQTVAIEGYMTAKTYDVLTAEGLMTQVVSYDWTFTAADLAAAGIELRDGAIVNETHRGRTRRYEAMDVGELPAVEEIDGAGILVLLHTKQID